MTSNRLPFLPDPVQELLLKAIVLDGDPAIEAWKAWCSAIAVEDIDFASQRLLPLLHDKLKVLGVDHPLLRKYRGVARYVWFDNQIHVRTAQMVFATLKTNGVRAMPLKGFAIAPLYYGDFRLRAMSDIDILVPVADVRRVANLLQAEGWETDRMRQLQSDAYTSTFHAAPFRKGKGPEIDLHWHASHEFCRPDADDAFWKNAQPFVFAGLHTETLSDTDHLFHTCIHGARPNDLAPIRWITDAAIILQRGTIDWQRLAVQARQFDLIRRVQRTLTYLQDVFALPVPCAFLDEMQKLEPSRIERMEDLVTLSGAHEFVKSAARRYAQYRRNAAGHSNDRGFLGFLQDAFATESNLQTLGWIIRRIRKGW